jgi:hypothetical protein
MTVRDWIISDEYFFNETNIRFTASDYIVLPFYILDLNVEEKWKNA